MTNLTIYDALCDDILSDKDFLKDYEDLVSEEGKDLEQGLYKRVLESAAIFACSDKEDNRIMALKILSKIMENCKRIEIFNRSCELIFVRLGCFPTIKMSLEEYKINDYFKILSGKPTEDIPIVLRSELLAKIKSNKMTIVGKDIFLTDYQTNVLSHLRKKRNISISAPTSAGKSYVLISYIIECLEKHNKFIIVYIVPTIALITQVQNDIKRALKEYKLDNVNIVTSYYEMNEKKHSLNRCVMILTQERLQSIESKQDDSLHVDLLIVDEAQNIEEDERGIILEDSIQQLKDWSPNIQVVFISPFTKNPEKFGSIFLCDNLKSIKTNFSPVSQNIIDVRIKKNFTEMYYVSPELQRNIKINFKWGGDDEVPETNYKRKAWFASKLIESGPTMVYCNGPVDCRKTADAISEFTGIFKPDKRVYEVINFLERNIHPKYYLINHLKKGIGYHYGKMPPSVRSSMETLFARKYIQAICCTSTLMEGINLPTKNIVLYKPTIGTSKPIKDLDLLNLAGRAGRLMKDFSGNIYCIDSEEWKGAKLGTERLSHEIISSMENVLSNKKNSIIEQLNSIVKSKNRTKDVEAAVTRFIINEIRQGKIETVEKIIKEEADLNSVLNQILFMVKKIADEIELPEEIILKNRSIDPRLQDRLYKYLKKIDSPTVPKHPSSGDFYSDLIKIIPILNESFNKTDYERYNNYHALIANWWASEKTLREIIDERIDYLKDNKNNEPNEDNINKEIENIFEIINKKIKYELCRDINCYIDILNYILKEDDASGSKQHIGYYIEMGAYNANTLLLLGNGIPRTLAILISNRLPKDLKDYEQCKEIISRKKEEFAREIPSILLDEILI